MTSLGGRFAIHFQLTMGLVKIRSWATIQLLYYHYLGPRLTSEPITNLNLHGYHGKFDGEADNIHRKFLPSLIDRCGEPHFSKRQSPLNCGPPACSNLVLSSPSSILLIRVPLRTSTLVRPVRLPLPLPINELHHLPHHLLPQRLHS